jgi:soluble epoxide hydrolase/lipid-phosphate phosphatase
LVTVGFDLAANRCCFSFQFIPESGEFRSNQQLASSNPSFSYQVYLGTTPEAAAAEMDEDPRMAIRSCAQIANSTLPKDFLRHNDTFLQPWEDYIVANDLDEIPFSGIMTKVVEDYMVRSYQKQGFYNSTYIRGHVQFLELTVIAYNGYQYGNRKLSHEFEQSQGNFTLRQPTFTLFPSRDPVANWEGLAKQLKSADFLLNHYNAVSV